MFGRFRHIELPRLSQSISVKVGEPPLFWAVHPAEVSDGSPRAFQQYINLPLKPQSGAYIRN